MCIYLTSFRNLETLDEFSGIPTSQTSQQHPTWDPNPVAAYADPISAAQSHQENGWFMILYDIVLPTWNMGLNLANGVAASWVKSMGH